MSYHALLNEMSLWRQPEQNAINEQQFYAWIFVAKALRINEMLLKSP